MAHAQELNGIRVVELKIIRTDDFDTEAGGYRLSALRYERLILWGCA